MNFELILNIICIISIVIFCMNFFVKFNNFFNIDQIIVTHFKMFNGNYFQMIIIYVLPIFIAIRISMNNLINTEILENVNLIITVLTSMFFAVLSILCSVNYKEKSDKFKLLITETFNSTLFEIMCCVILLLISFIMIFLDNFEKNISLMIMSVLVYYLLIIIILNVLILMKRTKVVFEKNITD